MTDNNQGSSPRTGKSTIIRVRSAPIDREINFEDKLPLLMLAASVCDKLSTMRQSSNEGRAEEDSSSESSQDLHSHLLESPDQPNSQPLLPSDRHSINENRHMHNVKPTRPQGKWSKAYMVCFFVICIFLILLGRHILSLAVGNHIGPAFARFSDWVFKVVLNGRWADHARM